MRHHYALAVLRAALLLTVWALLGQPATALAAGKPLKITVYGGTGNIGSRIVNEALSRGDQVTVVVRDTSKAPAARTGLTLVQGDALDSAAVARLAAGQDVLVSALNSKRAEGDNFYVRAGQSFVGALRTLGPKAPRLIVVGGAGSLEVAPGKLLVDTMPNADPSSDPVTQKAALEYYRTVKDVDWTFFSPSMRIEPGTRTGKFRIGGDQLLRDASGESRISMEDFAVAILDEAEHPQHLHSRITVGY